MVRLFRFADLIGITAGEGKNGVFTSLSYALKLQRKEAMTFSRYRPTKQSNNQNQCDVGILLYCSAY